MQLSGGTDNEGWLEILFQGEWGYVCDDGFDGMDAAVFCSMMGFR